MATVEKNVHKALMHPMRVAVLLRIAQTGKASPTELSKQLDESLNLVAYHVRVLLKHGAIERVDKKQRRGAEEHFYALKADSNIVAFLLGENLATATGLPPRAFLQRLLREGGNTSTAVATTIPIEVDAVGEKEIRTAVEELVGKLRTAEEASKDRAKRKAGAPSTFLNVGIVAFPVLGKEGAGGHRGSAGGQSKG